MSKIKTYGYKGYFEIDGERYYSSGHITAVSSAQASYYAVERVKADLAIHYFIPYENFKSFNFPSTIWAERNRILNEGIQYFKVDGDKKIKLTKDEIEKIKNRVQSYDYLKLTEELQEPVIVINEKDLINKIYIKDTDDYKLDLNFDEYEDEGKIYCPGDGNYHDIEWASLYDGSRD